MAGDRYITVTAYGGPYDGMQTKVLWGCTVFAASIIHEDGRVQFGAYYRDDKTGRFNWRPDPETIEQIQERHDERIP